MNDELERALLKEARNKRIHEFDDFKQDVFLYMLENDQEDISIDSAKKIANKIAHRIKRRQILETTLSFDENRDSIDFNDSCLWEDRHVI